MLGFIACGTNRDPDPERGVGEVQSLLRGRRRLAARHGAGADGRGARRSRCERGYEQATVWSFDANERANAFYEAHAFTRDGATRTEDVWAHIPEVRYRRDLA